MKYIQEVYNINDLNFFVNYLKKEVTNTFLITFQNTNEFIDTYEDKLITDQIVQSELKRFIFENPENPSKLLIYHEDIEKVIKILYKELVEKVLNKLVDAGILVMCWDDEKGEVIWKKKKGVHVSRRIRKIYKKP